MYKKIGLKNFCVIPNYLGYTEKVWERRDLSLKEIIWDIIKIDRRAIEKEEEYRKIMEDIEASKKSRSQELRDKSVSEVKSIIEDHQKKAVIEIEEESKGIIEEYKVKSENLKKRFEMYKEKVVEDSFEMILRKLEE